MKKNRFKKIFSKSNNVPEIATKEKNVSLKDLFFSENVADLYFKELAIKTAVNLIANLISKCPVNTYYDDVLNTKCDEYYRWNLSPNPNENANVFKHKIVEKLLLNEECLVVEDGDGDLWVADSFIIDSQRGIDEWIFKNIEINNAILLRSFKRSEVCYFKLNDLKITALTQKVTEALCEVLEQAKSIYKKSNGTKWKLKTETIADTSTEFEENFDKAVEKSLKQFLDSADAIFNEFEGYNLESLSSGRIGKNADDILKIRREAYATVASAFGISVSLLLGVGDKPKETTTATVSGAIQPITLMLSTEITSHTIDLNNWKKGTRTEFDIFNIQNVDISDLAGAVEKLIGSAGMNIDEARTKVLGLPALNTDWSQKYYITKNFASVDEQLNQTAKGGDNE